MSKLDKKKLNAEITNAVMEDVGTFEYLAMRHWKSAIGVFVALLVIFAIVLTVNYQRKSYLKKSSDVLAAAVTEKEITEGLAKYGDAPAAIHARLRLARIYANDKKFDEALKQFRAIEQSGAPREMLGRIKLNEGYMLENSEKFAEAADLFAAAGSNSANPAALRAEADFAAGRMMVKTNRLAEAVSRFEASAALLPEMDQTSANWCRMSRFMIGQIEKGAFGKYEANALNTAPVLSAAPAK